MPNSPFHISPDLARAGNSASRDQQGAAYTRIFSVEGLPPGVDTLQQAISRCGVNIGDQHPTDQGAWCTRISAVPACGGTARSQAIVTIEYGWYNLISALGSKAGCQIRISASSSTVQSNINPNTNQVLVVTYSDPNDEAAGSATNYIEINRFVNHLVIEFTRIETGSPLQTTVTYVGSVCNDAYAAVGNACDWLCRSINSQTLGLDANGNQLYQVTYCLEYAEEGWVQLGLYEDNTRHQIPTDVSTNANALLPFTAPANGQVANGVYAYTPRATNFMDLELPPV